MKEERGRRPAGDLNVGIEREVFLTDGQMSRTTVPVTSAPVTGRASGIAPGQIGACVWPGDGCQGACHARSRESPAATARRARSAAPTPHGTFMSGLRQMYLSTFDMSIDDNR
jgi:hypothetical protein